MNDIYQLDANGVIPLQYLEPGDWFNFYSLCFIIDVQTIEESGDTPELIELTLLEKGIIQRKLFLSSHRCIKLCHAKDRLRNL